MQELLLLLIAIAAGASSFPLEERRSQRGPPKLLGRPDEAGGAAPENGSGTANQPPV